MQTTHPVNATQCVEKHLNYSSIQTKISILTLYQSLDLCQKTHTRKESIGDETDRKL